MRYLELEGAAEALAARLESMAPEDGSVHVERNLAEAGLFAGMDVDPSELRMVAAVVCDLSAEAVELTRGDVAVALRSAFAVGYALGRMHDPEAGS